jgi:glutamate dehydrogenase
MATVRHASDESVIERLVHHALLSVPERPDLEATVRYYYAHVDTGDLEDRRVEDLFGLAVDHLQLASTWQPGQVAIEVANPTVEDDGWGSDRTVVRVVSADMPFLVDSVMMEISRQGIGIHFVVHPIMELEGGKVRPLGGPDGVSPDESAAVPISLISIEIDRQVDGEAREAIEEGLRRVLDDVARACRDGELMRARMREISASLAEGPFPVPESEGDETRELLDWLADDHFLFLGARDYELGVHEGEDVLKIVAGSGLGILDGDSHLGRPRRLSEMSPTARSRVRERRLLNLTKAGTRATVHRPAYLDYIGIKTFDDGGEVTGERRFLGLFTSEVYHRSVTFLPRIRRTVAEVIARSGYPSGGHDAKRLLNILERYPRDDLLQIGADELYPIAVAIAGLQERRRVRVFARRELFGRFVTVLVYLPRDRYNTSSRAGIEHLLLEAFGGTLADWDAEMSESVLARLRFLLRVDDDSLVVDLPALEARIEQLISIWDDGFGTALVSQFGEDEALRLSRTYGGSAFGPEYQRAFEPRVGAADVGHLEALVRPGDLRLNAYREPGRPPTNLKLKLYRWGERISLTSVMPSLTNLGVTVVDERPYEVRTPDGRTFWIYDFSLEHDGSELDVSRIGELVEETFTAVWSGEIDDDGFNRLILRSGLGPTDIAVLRAYVRYLHQIGFPYTPATIEQALTHHPQVARDLFELFRARFDPDGTEAVVSRLEGEIVERIEVALNAIASLDHDRVLRRLRNLITSTVRTSWGQREPDGGPRPYLALKFDCQAIAELPDPRPAFEIFAYSPRFEGVHLRAGPVARGGLRWSDRTEDYRTEVLGLLKAQMVKNAVIVPAGAKGGFVLKERPDDPTAVPDEVVACYRLFVSALLDLTDNFVEGRLVPPDRTRRYDGNDPYLVVAADKGTATFSDIANEVACERGFWLGDAFASGGSHGYDHKAMGITARGAWESVLRHFREIGKDVLHEPFTAVGIGDMSGDVFGNGMLRSRWTRLLAAFDHRHIFIDPDPDPERSFRERRRLFGQPRSSWADYDPELISPGGGVYPRTAKSIELSPEARAALGTDRDLVTPDELISVVLRAPADLLWSGGIGTYVKASTENNADVGDKANDAIRVDGRDLRCAVVGEGGNLGVTQRGRIEFARAGGRIFTDAIDNAGGVDCSDHEVNIKILLDAAVADGDLTDKQRNAILDRMTSEVRRLVLINSYRQALALSAARIDAPSLVDVHARYIDDLESRGLLVRSFEALPDAEELTERRLAGTGLTAPELCVLSAYTKNALNEEIIASDIPDDEAMEVLLVEYFPTALRERFADRISPHRLRREIIANRLANLVVDRGGVSMIYRLSQETGAPAADLAAAHLAAWTIFDLDELTVAIAGLDAVMPVEKQLAVHLGCRQLAERATRLLIRNRPNPFSAAKAIADLADPVAATVSELESALLGTDRRAFTAEKAELESVGVPAELATRAALLPTAVAALDIVAVADASGEPVRNVAAAYFAVADGLNLTWLRDRILALPRDTQWTTLARLTLRTDLYADHRQLTALVIASTDPELDAVARVDQWMRSHRLEVNRFRQTLVSIRSASADVTSLLVAAREVRNLIGRTRSSGILLDD